ncbi:hypothetical protein NST41_33900 [Paenibacillus sp. FSL L8-0696]|jgi:hypothetical protein|uniref:hypothetical protein n=1 Tax=Paenibacillus sp. FSL L8-0696 TaxID=2954524 RepID=UPI003119D9EC
MKESVLVLGVTSYNFKDETSGETKIGAHAHYVTDFAFNESDRKGMFPIKITVPIDSYHQIMGQKFPAICEFTTITLPDRAGKPKPTVAYIDYVHHQEIFKELAPAK